MRCKSISRSTSVDGVEGKHGPVPGILEYRSRARGRDIRGGSWHRRRGFDARLLSPRDGVEYGQLCSVLVPQSSGGEEDIALGPHPGIAIQAPGRDQHPFAVLGRPRQSRSAPGAPTGRIRLGARQLIPPQQIFTGEPIEMIDSNEYVGVVSAAGGLPAPAAVAILEPGEWRSDPISHRTAQTRPVDGLRLHDPSSL